MTCTGESPRKAGVPTTLLTTRTKTRIGTWNIRTLYETGKSAQVCQEMHRYNLKLLGLCETRWTGTGRTRLASRDTIIYSGQEEGQPYTHGVALLMTPEATRALLSWEPVSPRILTARFNSKGRRVTIIQCYAPTNMADIEDKVHFYEQTQSVINKVPARDMKILIGDLNAKEGTDKTQRGISSWAGTALENKMKMENFSQSSAPSMTWSLEALCFHTRPSIRPRGLPLTARQRIRRSLLDVRVKRGADAASDHHLVVAELKTKLKAYKDQAERPSHKFNVQCLKEKQKSEEFKIDLRNKFSVLSLLPEETIEEQWHSLRETWKATCTTALGRKTRKHKEWITSDTWTLITERKNLKDRINQTQDQEEKHELQVQYWEKNRQVKRSAMKDKRRYIEELSSEAETAAGQRNMKRLYKITRALSGENNNSSHPVKDKDKDGNTFPCEEEQRARWVEHFKETLNRPAPPAPPDTPPATQLLDIDINPPRKTEIAKAIKSLKSGKAAGPDGIPPEALKANIQTSADMLHPLLSKIWEQERVPEDWKRGHLIKLPRKGDLSSCNNWQGIMLLSIPGKVLTRILERLKTAWTRDSGSNRQVSDKIARVLTTSQPCALSSSSPWSGRSLCSQSLSTFRKHSIVSTEMSSGD